jgi:DNA-binding transcriptional LysR family regulator
MMASATELERRATGSDETLSGVVRVSANEILGVLTLPRLLPDFMEENPGIEVEIEVSNSAANLLKRDADIALRMFRPVQSDLVARKITEIPLGLYAHRDYLAAHPAPQSLDDLHLHRFIGFDRDRSLIEAAAAMGETFTPSDFSFRSDSMLAQIEAIAAGAGIGVTHQGLAQRMPGVERVLASLPLPNLELWIACHSDIRFNKRIRLLLDYLATRLKTPYR